MIRPPNRDRQGALAALVGALLLLSAPALPANGWSDPVEVRHDQTLCVTYSAKLAGENLIVRAKIEPGWHTFAMDNKVRADEKLAGRKSLGIDRQTDIAVTGPLAVVGTWKQSPPSDFSKPELRWFTFGFEKEAYFAAKVERRGSGMARIGIRGQACTDAICKNIDVEFALRVVRGNGDAAVDLRSLVDVRTARPVPTR